MSRKRLIAVFSAECSVCDETVDMVQAGGLSIV
jgi:hypothetical protein